MRKCPFWSSEEKNINCNTECPMHQELNNGEECVFKEYLEEIDLKFSNLIDNNGFEVKDELFEDIGL